MAGVGNKGPKSEVRAARDVRLESVSQSSGLDERRRQRHRAAPKFDAPSRAGPHPTGSGPCHPCQVAGGNGPSPISVRRPIQTSGPVSRPLQSHHEGVCGHARRNQTRSIRDAARVSDVDAPGESVSGCEDTEKPRPEGIVRDLQRCGSCARTAFALTIPLVGRPASAELAQVWPDFDRRRPGVTNIGPDLVQIWPRVAK